MGSSAGSSRIRRNCVAGAGAPPASGPELGSGVGHAPQVQQHFRVEMGGAVQVDDNVHPCPEAAGPPHNVQQGS